MKWETQVNVGQKEYSVLPQMHVIKSIEIDGKEVEFEVFLRLKEVPSEYGSMIVTRMGETLERPQSSD